MRKEKRQRPSSFVSRWRMKSKPFLSLRFHAPPKEGRRWKAVQTVRRRQGRARPRRPATRRGKSSWQTNRDFRTASSAGASLAVPPPTSTASTQGTLSARLSASRGTSGFWKRLWHRTRRHRQLSRLPEFLRRQVQAPLTSHMLVMLSWSSTSSASYCRARTSIESLIMFTMYGRYSWASI